MKVRILSGSQRGAVVEMEVREAETAIATGFAEFITPAVEIVPEPVVAEVEAVVGHPHKKTLTKRVR